MPHGSWGCVIARRGERVGAPDLEKIWKRGEPSRSVTEGVGYHSQRLSSTYELTRTSALSSVGTGV
jgi:hypothetical protein